MDDEQRPMDVFVLIVLGALIVETAPAERARVLSTIDGRIGDARVVPLVDGERARIRAELRRLYLTLLPTWLAP